MKFKKIYENNDEINFKDEKDIASKKIIEKLKKVKGVSYIKPESKRDSDPRMFVHFSFENIPFYISLNLTANKTIWHIHNNSVENKFKVSNLKEITSAKKESSYFKESDSTESIYKKLSEFKPQ